MEEKTTKTQNPRALSYALLCRLENDRVYSNILLDTALKRANLSAPDRGLLTVLTYGVIENRLTLDYIIGQFSSRPLKDISPEVLILLRMGIYQLRYLDRVPAHAALNETVALASEKCRGFVNAVLRAYTRGADTLVFPDPLREPFRALSVRYSVPEELCRRFCSIFGAERAARILEAMQKAPSLTLRVNTLRTTPQALAKRLKDVGISAVAAAHTDRALHLDTVAGNGNPTELPGFAEGEFLIQDEASVLCTLAAGVKPGDTVLDICACPGSKSFGMAMEMQNRGVLYAYDLHENKLSLIEKGAARLGITCLRTAARDGRNFDPALESSADCVLCDVPCSGFGVLAKKPEIRYKPLAEVAALPDIQLAILSNASRYVKAGGTLVYSTCTLLPEENEENVARFLASHPDFVPVPLCVGDLTVEGGMLTLTPDEHGTDGFFIAKLCKKG